MKKILFLLNLLLGIFIGSFAQVIKVGTPGITVKDMNTAVKFYNEVLGFQKISDEEFSGREWEQLKGIFGLHMRVVRMQLGDEQIELTDYLTTGGRSIPEDQKSNDLFFQHIAIVVSDMNKAYLQLRKYNVEFVSTAPQTLPATIVPAAGIKAFYFHDPDNHTLELIYFPKGKGQAKWQLQNENIFLGIDHTAIGISNTKNSLQFYQSILGIERKGESFNYGIEQEHLNNVEGASLHITGLRADTGPGIEFLQYLKPGAGKLYPPDTRADDLWFWQTTLYVKDITAVYHKLHLTNYHFVSKDLIRLKDANEKKYIAFIIKDPDGHAMLIREDI